MKYHIQTFGCQMNVSDSSWLERSLNAQGFDQTYNEDEADLFIVNTCSVREKPEISSCKALSAAWYLGFSATSRCRPLPTALSWL
ncbi:MAG: hypothetical protein R6X11_09295 [Desulfonatronovibrio sp.]